MIKREKVLRSIEYWETSIQLDLFNAVNDYLERMNMSRSDFADRLNVHKSYVSQILNGNFNFSLRKLIELSLAVNRVPEIQFHDLDEYIDDYIKKASSRVSATTTVKESEPKVVSMNDYGIKKMVI